MAPKKKTKIQAAVESALSSLDGEIKTHKDGDVIHILVVSEEFEGVRSFLRIQKALNLINAKLEAALYKKHCFIVEPVTPAELKTRKIPWPK